MNWHIIPLNVPGDTPERQRARYVAAGLLPRPRLTMPVHRATTPEGPLCSGADTAQSTRTSPAIPQAVSVPQRRQPRKAKPHERAGTPTKSRRTIGRVSVRA